MSKLKPPVNESDKHTGNKSSGIVLVEFGDYQCPHCGHAHPLLKKLIREAGSEFEFVFRNFPLQEAHPQAFMAALAAEAAGEQGKFWEMHDMIFENQNILQGPAFLDFAEQLALDLHKFGADWKSARMVSKVEEDFESGIRSGVNGTPTFFLNGERLNTYDGDYQSLLNAVRAPHSV
ncbi:MAG: thioredoxin domain-containing protein [Flavitalea sp.]